MKTLVRIALFGVPVLFFWVFERTIFMWVIRTFDWMTKGEPLADWLISEGYMADGVLNWVLTGSIDEARPANKADRKADEAWRKAWRE